MRIRVILLLVCCCVLFPVREVIAQSALHGENEFLSSPISSPRNDGVFGVLNSLPESIRRSDEFSRILYEFSHRATIDGTYDPALRSAGFEQAKADLFRDAGKSPKVQNSKQQVFADAWVNIGPSNIAGCTKALAFHPTSGNTIYAGGAAGGVWKTTNAGSSWVQLTDNVIPDLALSTIAVDPEHPDTLYVGSGDPAVAVDALGGTGLYKSTDGGASWSHIATSTFAKTVNKVLVHPSNSNIVFAASDDAANRGLYRSTNGGSSFTKVFPTSGTAQGVIWDVTSAQTISGSLIMYFVEGNNPGGTASECGIYKSIDDGQTWAKINSSSLPSASSIGKAALAIASSDKSHVYCFMANPNGDLSGAGLFVSTNSGSSFSKLNTVPSSIFNVGSGAQGWYDLYLAVAPGTNPNDTIYIGGIEAYRSFDGGASWQSYSDYNTHSFVHVDNQSIAIDPTNSRIVWIGTDGGVYRSTDAGQNWSYRSNGMNSMRCYHIGLDANDNKKTYAGFQDEGVWRTVSGQSPVAVFGGDGFQPIVDPTNSNIYYVEGPQGDLYKTTDGGNNFSSANGSNFEANSSWDTPFQMAPKNHTTLFTGRTMLWKTVNSGASWVSVSPTFGSSFVNCIGLSSSNSNVYMLGLDGGKVKYTADGGTTWLDKSTGIPGVSINYIACHPTDANFALIALNASSSNTSRVMLTTNGGTSWANVSGSIGYALPGVPVNCVAIDSTSPSMVWYAATNNGIYYTIDGGQKWSIAGSGIGLAACFDVQVHANGKTIRVGTHGRSLWEANTNILPVEFTTFTATKTSKGTQLSWRTDSEVNSSGFWVERSFNYQPFVDVAFVNGAGNSTTEKSYSFLDTALSSGHYIYQLKEVDLDGSFHYSNMVDVSYGSASGLRLDQNFPNPFVASATGLGSTRIHYELPDDDVVTMNIYNSRGSIVRTLVDHTAQIGGEQDVFWDGTDASGAAVSSGVYYYTLETTSGGRLVNKMVYITK
ncbi:MAG TPA: FlgD immunoglobulin-like domain containing protein [Candidatus Kapabacteria bacterium]|nr:FlgD immunoglobulin-like domain containing protein [Candidatus Kapabacteria bacterium]